MRIDPHTLLFHDLTADEAQVLQSFGEAVMLRGEQPEQPAMIQEWFKLKPTEFNGPNGIFALAAILPARIFYSLLLREQEFL